MDHRSWLNFGSDLEHSLSYLYAALKWTDVKSKNEIRKTSYGAVRKSGDGMRSIVLSC